jgi:hypothetical protein
MEVQTGKLATSGTSGSGAYIVIQHLGRWALLAFGMSAFGLFAQLTPEQKALDLQTIASLYAKQYAPYEWKRDNLGFDLFNLRPWLDRARQTKTDLEYLELLAEYTASLQDIHSYYIATSDFAADLHLFTDIYDGKVLIEQIDRAYLPLARFDFAVGDEIMQFNGKPVMEVIQGIAKLSSFGNPRSTLRWAADQLVYQQQAYLPRAVDLGAQGRWQPEELFDSVGQIRDPAVEVGSAAEFPVQPKTGTR